MPPPTRPPTADELLAEPVVQQALDAAWQDSLPNDPGQRHEEGVGRELRRGVSCGHQQGESRGWPRLCPLAVYHLPALPSLDLFH